MRSRCKTGEDDVNSAVHFPMLNPGLFESCGNVKVINCEESGFEIGGAEGDSEIKDAYWLAGKFLKGFEDKVLDNKVRDVTPPLEVVVLLDVSGSMRKNERLTRGKESAAETP